MQIKLDSDEILNHPETTNEIKECCKDIKVLGRKDIRSLLAWGKALNKSLFPSENKEEIKPIAENMDSEAEKKDPDEMDLEEIDKLIDNLKVNINNLVFLSLSVTLGRSSLFHKSLFSNFQRGYSLCDPLSEQKCLFK